MKKTAKKLTFEERKEKLVDQVINLAETFRNNSLIMSEMDLMEFASDFEEALEYTDKIRNARSTRDAQRYLKIVFELFDKS